MQLPEEVPGAVPPTELRKASVQEVHLASTSSSLLEAIQQLQARSYSLDRVVGRLALGLRKGRVPSAAPITAPEWDAARRLLFFEAQGKVRKKMSEGEYPGLGAWVSTSEFRGLWVTRGRIPSSSWRQLAGRDFLPLLPGSSWLAKAIILQEHQKDHRQEVGAVLALSRRLAWITGGRRLVKAVVKGCMSCRRANRKHQEQIMGDIGEENLLQVRPFQHLRLDLMGPFNTRGMGGNS